MDDVVAENIKKMMEELARPELPIALSKQNDGFDIVIGSVFNFSHSARENDARRVRGVISP